MAASFPGMSRSSCVSWCAGTMPWNIWTSLRYSLECTRWHVWWTSFSSSSLAHDKVYILPLGVVHPCANHIASTDAIALLDIATTATSHVMNPASARTNPPETIKFLWELSLRLAANVRLDEDDGSGKDSLLSLLTAIGECAPEELSIDFAATTWFFFHPSCWHAIHVFMRRSREFLPLSFVMFIYRCLNIQTEPSGILTEVEWNWLIESTAWCSTVVTPRTRYLDSAHIFH